MIGKPCLGTNKNDKSKKQDRETTGIEKTNADMYIVTSSKNEQVDHYLIRPYA